MVKQSPLKKRICCSMSGLKTSRYIGKQTKKISIATRGGKKFKTVSYMKAEGPNYKKCKKGNTRVKDK